MNPNHVIGALLIFCGVREVFYLYSVQKLVNKIMSRNYHEFQLGQNAGRLTETRPNVTGEMDYPEDLRTLSEIS